MNTFRVLSPDIQYTDGGLLELEVGAGQLHFDQYRWGETVSPESLQECQGLLVWHECQINPAYVKQLPNCRIIVRAGVGFDNVDLAAAAKQGIAVCNTPDYGTSEVADHALGLILALERRIVAYHQLLQQSPIDNFSHLPVAPGRRLRGQTLGLVGMGRIGTATAIRAKAFGLRVVIFDPYLPRGQEIAVGVERVETLQELARQSNILSVHTPLTAETQDMIDEEVLRTMPPDGLLINTARGGIVELDGVYQVLKEGHLRAAGLDVFPKEPPVPLPKILEALQQEEPWIRNRLIVTPHTAWYSVDSSQDLRRKSMETILLYLRDGILRNCVNAHLLPT